MENAGRIEYLAVTPFPKPKDVHILVFIRSSRCYSVLLERAVGGERSAGIGELLTRL